MTTSELIQAAISSLHPSQVSQTMIAARCVSLLAAAYDMPCPGEDELESVIAGAVMADTDVGVWRN